MNRVQTAYENLPKWLQQGVEEWNVYSFGLENGSYIETAATSKTALRSKSFNFILLDEFAFVDTSVAKEFYKSVYPTITAGTDSRLCIISTPNGLNHFYADCMKAERGESEFIYKEIHWNDVPGRDDAFRAKTISNIGLDAWEVEYECSFLGAENTLIKTSALKVAQGHVTEPETITGEKAYIWKQPEPGHKYMICADTAEGKGLDHSAFVMIDITKMPYHVVAVYKSNEVSPIYYPNILVAYARLYNNAYMLIEYESTGAQVATSVFYDLEYENILPCSTHGRKGQVLGSMTAYQWRRENEPSGQAPRLLQP